MDVGEILRQARERAGLTQQRLAVRAGTSRSILTKYETGVVSPTVQSLDRLLAAAGLQLRVALEPLLAHVDARLEQLLAVPAPLSDGALEALATVADSLDDVPDRIPPWGSAGPRRGPAAWALDGGTALRMHGLAADPDATDLVVAWDEACAFWLHAEGVKGRVRYPNGVVAQFVDWLDADRTEAAAALSGHLAFSRLGLLRVRVVETLPPAVAVLPEGLGRAVPVVSVDEVEQQHPAYAEVLQRRRERREASGLAGRDGGRAGEGPGGRGAGRS